ncbi:hypothetical protein M413DRAFT_26593 [Hebeloma cylindrosporum]|uniref:DUF6534 domain-containing protein n=1 Tax=Hebeloma cylindrosporum TaxID=76867 RepID=A0A0C2XY28_HEBCY|nr:hypothetical protein M413DRAFT_26593 [Hebeloma cylindrosporum h7]
MTRLDETLGAAFIGLVVASILYGVSVVQAWYYYTHQNDSWPIKVLVGAVMTFDTIHQVLITHTVYWYTVSSWGEPSELQLIVRSMLIEVIFNGLTALLVQRYIRRLRIPGGSHKVDTHSFSFLAMRVWRLSNGNKMLTGVVYLSISVNVLAAAGDVLIAGSLCFLLHRSRTGFQTSDTMINKLMLFSVKTGLLTSFCAVASLVSILASTNSFIYIAFFFCIGRLYSNTLLATLNSRKRFRNAGSGVNGGTPSDGSFPMKDFAKPTTTGSHVRPAKNISIQIDTTKDFSGDEKCPRDVEGPEVV